MGVLTYYTTLEFDNQDGTQVLGFRYSDRDFGEDTDVRRAAGGVRVFGELVSALEKFHQNIFPPTQSSLFSI